MIFMRMHSVWIPVRIPPRTWQDLGPPGGGGGHFLVGDQL